MVLFITLFHCSIFHSLFDTIYFILALKAILDPITYSLYLHLVAFLAVIHLTPSLIISVRTVGSVITDVFRENLVATLAEHKGHYKEILLYLGVRLNQL